MDTVPLPTKIIRIDSRHRRQAHDVARREVAQVQVEEEEESLQDIVSEPLLIREQKGRAVMGRAHRLFHRRQAQAPPAVLTVNVEVVATLDTAGNVVALQTATPQAVATEAAVVAAVASVPSAAVPSVPAVPPFPSDLNVPSVPAYPWPSGVPSAQAVSTSVLPASSAPLESTSELTQSSVAASPSMSGFNSTTSSITSTASSSLNTTSSTLSSSSWTSSTLSSTQSSVTSTPTSAQSTSVYWIASSTAGGGGAGGFVAPEGTGAPATPSTASTTDTDSSGPLETPGVVGAVVGSLAGFALLLALILFLIRRHKQKQNGGPLQLTGDDTTDNNQSVTPIAPRASFAPPSFLNRFSGVSRSTADSSGTGERSFQRISGRKLPSAFSEGMTSEQFAAGRGEGTLSGSSFYQDEKGFYGGPGVTSKDFGEKSGFAKEIGETSNTGTMGTEERVRPSPARTPVIHHADDGPGWGTLSPPLTPNADIPRGSLGRSHVSRDGSRSSRFTENV